MKREEQDEAEQSLFNCVKGKEQANGNAVIHRIKSITTTCWNTYKLPLSESVDYFKDLADDWIGHWSKFCKW